MHVTEQSGTDGFSYRGRYSPRHRGIPDALDVNFSIPQNSIHREVDRLIQDCKNRKKSVAPAETYRPLDGMLHEFARIF
jgi:hypothetical protein